MTAALRVLLGAMLGVLAWVVSFFLFNLLVVWSGWLTSLRTHHLVAVINTSQILAVTPCVIALGAAFGRMFGTRQTLCAIVAMSIALVFVSAATRFPPGSWSFVVLPFLLGPAFVAYVLSYLRSINRQIWP